MYHMQDFGRYANLLKCFTKYCLDNNIVSSGATLLRQYEEQQ